jgi:hypothetical protein
LLLCISLLLDSQNVEVLRDNKTQDFFFDYAL